MTSTRPALFLVDDEAVVRRGLALVLGEWFEIIGEASDADGALEQLPALEPDLVLVDLHLGSGPNGLSLTRELKTRRPELRVLMLSSRSESLFAERALEAGALGFVMKSVDLDVLQASISRALGDRVALSDDLRRQFLEMAPVGDPPKLDHRELAVIQALGQGATTPAQVQSRTGLDTDAVANAIWRLQVTFGLPSWATLLLWAERTV